MAAYTTSLGGIPSLFTMDLSKGWDLNAQVDSAMQASSDSTALLNPEGVPLPNSAANSVGDIGVGGGLSIGMAIGQAIGGAFSAYTQSKTSGYVLKQQRKILEANKAVAQMGAESAMRAGESQIAQITYQAGQTKAKQRANYAASGVALGDGSVRDVLTTTDVLKKLDTRTARMNALASAWGYRRQALGYGSQASVAGTLSDYYSGSALGSAFGSLIEGGTSVAERWYRLRG